MSLINRPASTPENIFREIVVKDYVPAEHISYLSSKLEDVLTDNNTYDRLCISLPPRTGKSSLITLAFPFWLIMNNPDLNIVIVNNTQTLAENFGIRLRQLFIDYKDLLEEVNICLSSTKHSINHFIFETRDGQLYKGSIKLIGTGATITGTDVDVLIADDLIKGFVDTTPTQLRKKREWFNSIILQRLEPHSKLIILGTRWASDDIIGYLYENHREKYEFIKYKALTDNDTKCIWSERYTPDFFIDRREEMGERMFNALYQQEPLDLQGTFFNTDKLIFNAYEDDNSNVKGIVRSWDLAYSDETKGDLNDYTAGVFMKRTINDYYIISDIKHGQYGDDLISVLRDTAYYDKPNVPVLVETGTRGGASKFYFNELRNNYMRGYSLSQSEPVGSKQDRAMPFRDAILDGRVIINVHNDELKNLLLQQMKSFPLGKHDDLIDACSYAYNHLAHLDKVNGGGSFVSVGSKRRRISL